MANGAGGPVKLIEIETVSSIDNHGLVGNPLHFGYAGSIYRILRSISCYIHENVAFFGGWIQSNHIH